MSRALAATVRAVAGALAICVGILRAQPPAGPPLRVVVSTSATGAVTPGGRLTITALVASDRKPA